MKQITFILFLILGFSAFAGPINYTPTNFTGDKQEVRDLFDQMWSKFKSWDYFHCYRRAQVLVHQLDLMDIKPVKVFYFRGSKATLPRNWYYHVAPAVYYKGEVVIMDRALFEAPSYGKDWIDALSDKSNCIEFEKYEDFKANKKNVDCGFIVTSMYTFGPRSLDEDRSDFVRWELIDSLDSMTRRNRKKFLREFPLP